MAVLSRSLLALSCLAVYVSAGVCPGGNLDFITDMAPGCFDGCTQLCGTLSELMSKYMETQSADALKPVICEKKADFGCFFQTGHKAECHKVLAMGASMGAKMPMSEKDLEDQCAALETQSGHTEGGAASDGESAHGTASNAEQHGSGGNASEDEGSPSGNVTSGPKHFDTKVDTSTGSDPHDLSSEGSRSVVASASVAVLVMVTMAFAG